MSQPRQQVVLITGASAGFGLATAKLLAQRGFSVFGTSRHPDQFSEIAAQNGFTMLELDVRSDESARACVQAVHAQAGRIDVLINNAGITIFGALEEFTLDQARAQFETNFFGAARMVNAVLPIMRNQGGGKIINISSLGGLIGTPGEGYYCASKHALEGYSAALRQEVRAFNIDVSVIGPGFFKTEIARTAQAAANPLPVYDGLRERVSRFLYESVEHGADPANVARLILHIIESKHPRLRYGAGFDGVWLARLLPFIPRRLGEPVLRKVLGVEDSFLYRWQSRKWNK
jgi:NAD(P)-dependent dehydrogenase (short-subunit alcohol dehydrogenase family)